ncbi:MAG: internal scaffolding protein [Microvirus sp.]|nr:MAG: internal scaffolding protein [Microvirus sp.]
MKPSLSPLFLTPYTIPEGWNDLSALKCEDPSLAVQSEKDACDINNIVKSFGLTGELPYGVAVPQYVDYMDVPNDYHAAINYVLATDEAFLELPAQIRARFGHDAGAFLDFVNDESNYDEAVSLGLVPKRPVSQAPVESDAGATSP